jgi:hypothetical protein
MLPNQPQPAEAAASPAAAAVPGSAASPFVPLDLCWLRLFSADPRVPLSLPFFQSVSLRPPQSSLLFCAAFLPPLDTSVAQRGDFTTLTYNQRSMLVNEQFAADMQQLPAPSVQPFYLSVCDDTGLGVGHYPSFSGVSGAPILNAQLQLVGVHTEALTQHHSDVPLVWANTAQGKRMAEQEHPAAGGAVAELLEDGDEKSAAPAATVAAEQHAAVSAEHSAEHSVSLHSDCAVLDTSGEGALDDPDGDRPRADSVESNVLSFCAADVNQYKGSVGLFQCLYGTAVLKVAGLKKQAALMPRTHASRKRPHWQLMLYDEQSEDEQ